VLIELIDAKTKEHKETLEVKTVEFFFSPSPFIVDDLCYYLYQYIVLCCSLLLLLSYNDLIVLEKYDHAVPSVKGDFVFAGGCSPYSYRKGAVHQRTWLGKRAHMKMFAAKVYKVLFYLCINNSFFFFR
jgi:hypothetical protein